MRRQIIIFVLTLSISIVLVHCRKSSPKSSDRRITSFVLHSSDNAAFLSKDVIGQIRADSIILPIPGGTALSSLVPAIDYIGAGINPANHSAQNFSNPVRYTVTAADGSRQSYTVVSKLLSNQKAITSFQFKTADNPGLSADISGVIVTDTIEVIFNGAIGMDSLVPGLAPSIVYSGVAISPASGIKTDYSWPQHYTVTAEDGSQKDYTVIVSINQYLYAGSNDGYIYALDAATGTLKWKYATGGGVASSPTISNGVVYVGSGDGLVYAINASEGSLKWTYTPPPFNTAVHPVNSNPTVQQGLVYVNVYGFLVAIDAMSGVQQWKQYMGPYSDGGSPTVINGVVYNANSSGSYAIQASDAGSGSLLWQYNGGIGRLNPALANGIVYGTNETDILDALDAQTGNQLFRYFDSSGSSPGNSPTVANGIAYIGTYHGGVYAIDARTGALKWKQGAGGTSCPIVWNGMVYFSDASGHIYALDALNGNTVWSVWPSPPNGGTTSPTVAHGILYYGSVNGQINARDARNGQLKWSFQTGGSVYSGPCIIDAGGNAFHPNVSGDQQ